MFPRRKTLSYNNKGEEYKRAGRDDGDSDDDDQTPFPAALSITIKLPSIVDAVASVEWNIKEAIDALL